MEVQGKVCAVLDEQRFKGSRGDVVKNYFVVETGGKYHQKLKFEVFGEDLWSKMRIAVGSSVSVSFDIKGSEWNGKYFVNLSAWMVKTLSSSDAAEARVSDAPKAEAPKAEVKDDGGKYDDQLPF